MMVLFAYVYVLHLFQFDVGQSSEMKFCTVNWHTTPHCHVDIWILSSFRYFSQNTHCTNFIFPPLANVCCVPCEVRPVGWWKGFVFPVGLYVVAALFPLLLGLLTNISLKCQSDNLEPQEMRWIKFFIIERSVGWKNSFFVYFHIHLPLE
jgi:hypothetical protein